jgi:PKD repeat protein
LVNNIFATNDGTAAYVNNNSQNFVQSNNHIVQGNVGNWTSNPGFMNPAHGDYSLNSGSVCIDAGFDYPEYPVDLAGKQVIGKRDIGAYEFQGDYEPPVCTKPYINDFWHAVETVKIGMPVLFHADITSECPVTYSWKFDYGSPHISTDTNPSVIWNKTGLFDISLEINSDGGTHYLQKTNFVAVVGDIPDPPCDTIFIYDTIYLPGAIPKIHRLEISIDPRSVFYKDGTLYIKQPTTIRHEN